MKLKMMAWRVAKEIKRKEVAEKLGVSLQTVANWETGRKTPNAKHFIEYCRVLKISPNDVIL